MKKEFKRLLPFLVGILVLVLLIAIRAYSMGKFSTEGRYPDVHGGTYKEPLLEDGVKYLVPPDELFDSGLGKDGLPALTNPKYDSVLQADTVLADDVEGISVDVEGVARFYSFQILNWHGLVNDTVNGKDLLISYSPFCGSAVVYERAVADLGTLTFGDAGSLYNNCMMMHDDKGSTLWNQATGEAVVGQTVGTYLTRYPLKVMTWTAWKAEHPLGQALSTDTGFTREYRRHPYGAYETSDALFFPLNETQDYLGQKEPVWDVQVGNTHYGLSTKLVSFMGDLSASEDYAAFVDGKTVHLFSRKAKEQYFTFTKKQNVITDAETGSTWNTKGVATAGPMKGTHLEEAEATARYFAFAYFSQYPEAIIPGKAEFDAAKAAAGNTDTSKEKNVINIGQ